MPYWYRPAITREEAIEYVRHLEPGGFIVRDSQTVSGGYALTIKVRLCSFKACSLINAQLSDCQPPPSSSACLVNLSFIVFVLWLEMPIQNYICMPFSVFLLIWYQISEQQVRQRRKVSEAVKVTEDMCVTHFLIQPDPDGVKLQGWNERAFSRWWQSWQYTGVASSIVPLHTHTHAHRDPSRVHSSAYCG